MKPISFSQLVILVLVIGFVQPALADLDISEEKKAVIDQVDALEQEIENMSMELWNYSEIALREVKSAEFLAATLEAEGFKLERGVADMPTAFVAEWGDSGPVIGILAEYDALPNIGNEPVPLRQARADGNPHGHGCGRREASPQRPRDCDRRPTPGSRPPYVRPRSPAASSCPPRSSR